MTLEEAKRNLTFGDLKLRKLVTKYWVNVLMCLTRLRWYRGRLNCIYFFEDCCWQVKMWKKEGGGVHHKKKIFISNSVDTPIQFKEGHQGPLKVHTPLGEGRKNLL